MSIIDEHLSEFDKSIDHLREEISTLKTGRANPAILDGITVLAYEVPTPLSQVASINVPEARSIVIQPWDKGLMKDLEKALRDSDLDLGIANEGERIRLTLPLMTEESRKEIVKTLHTKIEDARIAVRNVRDKIKEAVLEAEKNKEFGEDEKFGLIEELDKKNGEYNDTIGKIGDDKEAEIMKI
jgi:ribosome recycling factor